MSLGEEHADRVKVAQAAHWRDRAAIRLERADLIERHWARITARLLEIVNLRDGDRVLDIGTGHGEPAITMAAVVGGGGRVVGIDLSPEMIEVAQRRAELAGVQEVEWLVQDAEKLDVQPGSFDAAVARNSLMFLPEPERAIALIFDALRPGGRFALAVVGPEKTQPQWTMTIEAIARSLEIAPPRGEVGQPGVYSISDRDLLERLLRGPGFTDVAIEESELVYDFTAPPEVVAWHAINPTIMSMFAGQPEGLVQAAWQAVVDAATSRADPDGHVRISSQILYASGARPL
jgi:ubiquinone/menaquinone biosynthesis C-methylase UbiE